MSGRYLALFFVFTAACMCSLTVVAAPVDLVPGRDYRLVDSHVVYLEDADRALSLEAAIDHQGFQPVPGGLVGFGSSHSAFWLKLPLKNAGDDVFSWKLQLRARFMEPLVAWWVPVGGRPLVILESDLDVPFAARSEPRRYMTGEISLAPEERGELFVRYVSGGNTAMPVSLLTLASLAEEENRESSAMALFVGAIITLVLVNLFQFFVLRQPAYLYYALQETLAATYIAHMEGFTFQFLWPNAPEWNAAAAPLLGVAMLLSAALFMRSFLDLPRSAPRLNLLVLAYVTFYTAVLVAQPFIDKRLGNTLGLYGGIIIFPLLMGTGLWFSLVRRERSAFYYLAGWLAAGAGGLFFAAEQLDFITGWIRGIDGLKLGVTLEALILSFALADQVRAVRLQRDLGQRELLDITERRLLESQQLVAMEREKRKALEQAHRADEKLAHTSHDLRGPLYALRLALRSVGGIKEDGAVGQQLEQTFGYLEELISGLVGESRDTPHSDSESETLGAIISRCADRHRDAAAAADISLRVVPCELLAPEGGAAMERIIDNLLSNAVRYGGSGKVLVGVRRRSGSAELQVLDQGQGIAEDKLALLSKAYTQSGEHTAESDGYGLGLAIVATLCEEIGAALLIRSEPGLGSVFAVSLPRSLRTPHADADTYSGAVGNS